MWKWSNFDSNNVFPIGLKSLLEPPTNNPVIHRWRIRSGVFPEPLELLTRCGKYGFLILREDFLVERIQASMFFWDVWNKWLKHVCIYIYFYTYIINKCWRTIFAIEPWFFRLQGLDIVSLNEHILDILRKNQGVFPPLKMTKQFFQRIGGWLNVGYTTWGGYLQRDEVQYKILGPGIQPASQTPVPWTWQIEPVDWLWRWNNRIFRCEDLLKWFFSCVCVLMFGGEVFHWYRSTFLIDRLNLVNITWT